MKQLIIHGKIRRVKRFRRALEDKGYTYAQTGKYTCSLSNNFENLDELRKDKRKYSRKRGLFVEERSEEYIRSNNYRKLFFDNVHPLEKGKYRCIYCGRKLPHDKVTVDHILPVSETARRTGLKLLYQILGLESINDLRNLGAACERCNKSKGKKTGLWLIRGFAGKSETLWHIRFVIRIILIVVLIALIIRLQWLI